MKTLTKKILEDTLAGTCLYPKYPNGDLKESHPNYPFVDSSITDQQFKEEAERFNPLNEFWEVLDHTNLEGLKNKTNIFVMHPFKQEIINPNQLAIPLETLMYVNHKATIAQLNTRNQKNIWQYELDKTGIENFLSELAEQTQSKGFVLKTPFSAAGDGVFIYSQNKCHKTSIEKISQLINLSKSRGNNNYLVQEFISGIDLSLQGFISKSGQLHYVGSGTQKIGDFGEYEGLEVSTNLPKQAHINLLENASNIASKKGFYGFFGLDIKETQTGDLHIIDPNFRPTDGTPKYLKQLGIL
jgi:hypothetical protein